MVCIQSVQQFQTLNTGIDLFCIFELIIILFYIRQSTADTLEYIFFRRVLFFTILALAGDCISWLVNGQLGNFAYAMNYISNFVYMMAQLVASVYTFIFLYWISNDHEPSHKFYMCAVNLPLMIIFALASTTFWSGLVYSVDPQNIYERGILLPYLSMMTLAYIFAGCFISASQVKHEILMDRKRRFRVLSCYCLPIIVGSLIQTCFYGISLVLPFSSLALLMVFINEQDLKISIDSLTGLNNRGCFDRYLNSELDTERRSDLAVIMIDINNFKKINDEFGHVKGDMVLKVVAHILQRAAVNKDVFLARYGGDEFAYVFHLSQITSERIDQSLEIELSSYNQHSILPINICLATGSASYEKGTTDNALSLVHRADEVMYENKRKMKVHANEH